MSTVTGINSGTTTSTQVTKSAMGKEDFLKMLLAQLKNQDPLNPVDSKDFAAQLAQFSSLEQLQNVNTQLGSLGSSLSLLTNGQLANIIGNEVSAKGNTINVKGSSNTLYYNLPSDIGSGTIKIYNSTGNLVKTLTVGSQKAGVNSTTWDCSKITSGTYTYEVSASDGNGNNVSVSALTTGTVTGVTFKNGSPYVTVNGKEIAFSDVVSIGKTAN
ncbi:MAG: flagellar hook capping FlgD N-terminal domain-containing protein [Syntrophaceae bacterium]